MGEIISCLIILIIILAAQLIFIFYKDYKGNKADLEDKDE